jgi:hypothetical protein
MKDLCTAKVQPDTFCENQIFAQMHTSSELNFIENLLNLQQKKYLDIFWYGETPLKCLRIQKIKDEKELDSILKSVQ